MTDESTTALGDLLAFGHDESLRALARKDREQYQFWQGWNAALDRVIDLRESIPTVHDEPLELLVREFIGDYIVQDFDLDDGVVLGMALLAHFDNRHDLLVIENDRLHQIVDDSRRCPVKWADHNQCVRPVGHLESHLTECGFDWKPDHDRQP